MPDSPQDAKRVERWARKIASEIGYDYDTAFTSKNEWTAAGGMRGDRFVDINEPRRGDFDDAARAAIALSDQEAAARGGGEAWAEWERLRDAMGTATHEASIRAVSITGSIEDFRAAQTTENSARAALDAFVRQLLNASTRPVNASGGSVNGCDEAGGVMQEGWREINDDAKSGDRVLLWGVERAFLEPRAFVGRWDGERQRWTGPEWRAQPTLWQPIAAPRPPAVGSTPHVSYNEAMGQSYREKRIRSIMATDPGISRHVAEAQVDQRPPAMGSEQDGGIHGE